EGRGPGHGALAPAGVSAQVSAADPSAATPITSISVATSARVPASLACAAASGGQTSPVLQRAFASFQAERAESPRRPAAPKATAPVPAAIQLTSGGPPRPGGDGGGVTIGG